MNGVSMAKDPGQNKLCTRPPTARDGESAGNRLQRFRPRQRCCSSVEYARVFSLPKPCRRLAGATLRCPRCCILYLDRGPDRKAFENRMLMVALAAQALYRFRCKEARRASRRRPDEPSTRRSNAPEPQPIRTRQAQPNKAGPMILPLATMAGARLRPPAPLGPSSGPINPLAIPFAPPGQPLSNV